jgi:nucleoside-diphosphate-sugar epimerase
MPLRVLVTGGSGRVGHFVVDELVKAGFDVTNMDIRYPARPIGGVRTILGDAAKMEDAFGALTYSRAEAVVHLAAWSDPGFVADSRTYADNVAGTFNILNAAASLGIKRAILASSAQVYGFAELAPVYAKVDENHPLRPLNCYALSKICGEQTGNYFAARHGMEVASFRIMAARAPADLDAEVNSLRAEMKKGQFLLWNRTDARDVGRACQLALAVPALKSGPYNITAARNALARDSADLLLEFCPQTEITMTLTGDESILSCQAAWDAFGYRAEYR